MQIEEKLKIYYITAVLGVVFAVVGFTYNAWRLEVSEDNNNIRTASFEVLKELAELEQIVYAAHYDKDQIGGNPRKGWVKIGLILDLSALISPPVETQSEQLKQVWQDHWQNLPTDRQSAELIISHIGQIRDALKTDLQRLQ